MFVCPVDGLQETGLRLVYTEPPSQHDSKAMYRGCIPTASCSPHTCVCVCVCGGVHHFYQVFWLSLCGRTGVLGRRYPKLLQCEQSCREVVHHSEHHCFGWNEWASHTHTHACAHTHASQFEHSGNCYLGTHAHSCRVVMYLSERHCFG